MTERELKTLDKLLVKLDGYLDRTCTFPTGRVSIVRVREQVDRILNNRMRKQEEAKRA